MQNYTPEITHQLIEHFDEFLCLETQWEALRTNTSSAEFCVNWHWLRAWYETYWQQQNKLFIHAYYVQDILVAVLPCYLKKVALGYELRFMATGDRESIDICSEFQDFIIAENVHFVVFKHFSQQILATKSIIALVFNHVLPTALIFSWWNSSTLKAFTQYKTVTGKRYCIAVQPTTSAQIAQFKSKSTRRQAKKYLALSDCYIEHLDDENLFDHFYQSLIVEHNRLWQARGKQGAFEQAAFVSFHKKLAIVLLKQNRLVFFKLKYKQQCVAIFYGIIDQNTLYYYQSAVGQHSDIPSVGVAMHIEALNIAREKGLTTYDLMKGQNASYKSRYINGEPAVYTISFEKARYRWSQKILKLTHKIIG